MRTDRPTLLALALLGLLAPKLAAQDADPPATPRPAPIKSIQTRSEAAKLQTLAFRAIDGGQLDRAAALLRRQITLDPDNFVPHYNLACVLSLTGDGAAGISSLLDAISRGFVDIGMMRRDPQLAAAREQDAYQRLVGQWPRVLDAHLASNLEVTGRFFRDGRYHTERDERMRIAFVSAFDAGSFRAAREEVELLYDWGLDAIFADLVPDINDDRADPDPWAIVILPSAPDFRKWAIATYGPSAITGGSGIGGAYDHDTRRLVAMDLGATLRHEFFHILHWRSAARLGQDHPIWIQEGLCSLVEDYDRGPDGQIIPAASWRTNIARRLLLAGRLPHLRQLATMPRDRFVSGRPLATYGHSRAVFLYLSQTGKLGDWYRAYLAGHDKDPSGIAALESIYARGIDEIDRDFRDWLRALPQVADQNRPGRAGFGAELEPGTGDGPIIVQLPPPPHRSAARAAGLRRGDVISSIDSRPIRDLNDLTRILGEYDPGDEVEIGYRRGSIHGSVGVKLTTR